MALASAMAHWDGVGAVSQHNLVAPGEIYVAGRTMRYGRTPILIDHSFWNYGGASARRGPSAAKIWLNVPINPKRLVLARRETFELWLKYCDSSDGTMVRRRRGVDGELEMDKFTTLTGVAALLPMINVDTDMIIPKQFLKTIKRTGLGVSLFFDMRYDDAGQELADFVLNRPAYRDAKILITGENFGCGSSREHAPWALLDFGIACLIAPSFADIFYNNCFKNGILPISLPQRDVDRLMADAEQDDNATFSIDLEAQHVSRPNGETVAFEIDPFRKQCLIEGLDDIELTLRKSDAIETFEKVTAAAQPWL